MSGTDLSAFKKIYNQDVGDEASKIKTVQTLFKKHQIDRLINIEIKQYSTRALDILEELSITKPSKNALKALVLQLENRKK